MESTRLPVAETVQAIPAAHVFVDHLSCLLILMPTAIQWCTELMRIRIVANALLIKYQEEIQTGSRNKIRNFLLEFWGLMK